jgi:beta-lactam-binding protein with PASTA domain
MMDSGPRVVTVPDVAGFEAAEAAETVRAAGMRAYGPAYTDPPETGTVTGQAPTPGARAVPGAPVVLTTSTGGFSDDPGLPGVPIPG